MNDLKREILNRVVDRWYPHDYLADGSVKINVPLQELHRSLGGERGLPRDWLIEALKELAQERIEAVCFGCKLNGPIARNVSFVGEYVRLHLSNVYAFEFYGGSRERMQAFLAAQ